MKALRGILLAMWLTAVTADGLAAPAKPAPTSSATAITIPFVPPIGKAMRLRVEQTVANARGNVETPVETTTSEEELLFTGRDAAGYALRWTTTSAAVHAAAPDEQAVMEAVVAVSVGKPILMQLGASGTPTKVANMAEMRAILTSSFDTAMMSIEAQFAARSPAERDETRKVLAGLAALYRDLPDADLSQLVLEDARTIFGFGGGQFEPGVPRPFMTSITVPVVNQPMDIQGHLALKSASAGELVIGSTIAINPDAIKAVIAAFTAKIAAGLDAAQQDQAKAEVNQLQNFELTIDLTLTLDASTGMVKRAVLRKRSGMPGQTQIETKTFTRIE